ncbi:MAG: YlxM family DNA-binding protein [Lachnospiraceae bacterium]|nr:YlxM family DNA-binding protein [Lachnospiraceae bacterium]
MDNLIERGMLFDFYGDLLTEHQQKIYSAVVFDDLSLGEISEETGVSRQGIYDIIKRCDKILEGYEDKLGLVDKFRNIKGKISKIDESVQAEQGLSESFKERIRTELKDLLDMI